MKKNNKFKIVGLFFILIFIIAGCGSNRNSTKEENLIRIGSKDFTENQLVSEIYALALENSGYQVERKFNVASSVIHTAIVNDEIDLYPEYTGTGLLSILKLPLESDPQKVFEIVKEEYNNQFDLTWLDYANVNNSQGLVIRTDVANSLGITTISDLQKHASELRFASQGEFDYREDGMIGLETVYGKFDWKSSTVYDNSLKYEVLRNDEADVAPSYTTEGQLVNTDEFTVLEDDKRFWPPYNLAPVIQNTMLSENPEIKDVLNKVNSKLNTEKMIELNAKVDVEGQEVENVAREFFETIKN